MNDEFASAAMMRVLIQGLKELRLPPLTEVSRTQSNQATVDLDLKLALVQHALKHGGVDCLIHLGCGVHQHENEPTHRAIVGAKDPIELVVRWQRLERYIHSRHRLRIEAQGEGRMEITHNGITAGISPTLYESLVVFGVIASLLQAQGVGNLEIYTNDLKVFPVAPRDALMTLPAIDPLRSWRLTWVASAKSLTRVSTVNLTNNYFVGSDWPQWQRQLASRILERLIDVPTVSDAASHLNVSKRTLQRDLKQRGMSFSELVGDCRSRVAAMHLMESSLPLAEIGFLCGYSDQSHFTRDFGKRVGITPEKYRAAFGLDQYSGGGSNLNRSQPA